MIVKMKKLNIVGLSSEKKMVLDVLRSTGCFELAKVKNVANGQTLSQPPDSKLYEQLHQLLRTLKKTIEAVEKSPADLKDALKNSKRIYKKSDSKHKSLFLPKWKKPLFSYKKDVSSEDLSCVSNRKEEIEKSVERINNCLDRVNEIDRLIEENNKECLKLQPYKNVDVPLSDIHDRKNLFMILGTLTKKAAKKSKPALLLYPSFTVRSFACSKKEEILFVSGPAEQKQEAERILDNSLTICEINSSLVPKDAIESFHHQNIKLYEEKLQILHGIASESKTLDDIKMYYDSIVLEIEMLDAQADICETRKTFSIEGWVPSENAEEIVIKIKAASVYTECELFDGEKDELPPTLTRSNALVSPYEAVTNMYSPPSPFEKDPNPFVGIFFFIFFGIMIGDAIYGIALFIITFVLMRCYKMETGFKKLMMILCMGGISAFIWGAVYNSWAAIGLPYNPLFNPVENPFDFLMISLGFGYFQIVFGFLLKLIANLRGRDFLSALADSGWKLLIMLGGAINIPSLLKMFERQLTVIKLPSVPPLACYIGLGMIACGLVGMLATGGRHKRSIGGKIVSGIGSWYDLVGLLSDVLSYCRLFGLALSGAIIGMVANILASDVLFPIPVVGYALGIAVAVFFHVFNLALACLSAYVHNSRLQFVEFFGKFYEGGGRSFKPLGHCTRYTSVKK